MILCQLHLMRHALTKSTMKSTDRYSEEDSHCFKRVKKGRGFAYLDQKGEKIGGFWCNGEKLSS